MEIIKKIIDSTIWSLNGLAYAVKHELSFKLDLLLALILWPTAFFLAKTNGELLWLLFSVFFVLIVELLNTAVEATVNRISTDQHPLAKIAKDCGSAAVMCALLLLVVIWSVIIFQPLRH